MKVLNNNELNDVKGGGFTLSLTACIAIATVASFVIGLIDGIVSPQSCN